MIKRKKIKEYERYILYGVYKDGILIYKETEHKYNKPEFDRKKGRNINYW